MPKRSEADEHAPPGGGRPRPRAGTSGASPQLELDFVRFRNGAESLDLAVDLASDTIWATAAQIADLFGVAVSAVAAQVDALRAEGGLSAANHRAVTTTRREDGREVARSEDLYDLDAILGVGYRVASAKAVLFRRWATQSLRGFVIDGYVIDEARLRGDRAGANALAARLRDIRADENNIYESVREFFQAAAGDFDERSDACAAFTAMLGAKFIFAATGETASDLILDRADHAAPGMGLRTFGGPTPTIAEAKIAKNYLDADELFILHTLCEQFLLYIQNKALRKQPMTMRELSAKLDDLLRMDDYPVLAGHKDFHKDRAIRHAQAEYARFIMRAGREPKAIDR